MKSLPLQQYIRIKYSGNKAEFAKAFGMPRQNVNNFLKGDHFVIDGKLYRKMKYELSEYQQSQDKGDKS